MRAAGDTIEPSDSGDDTAIEPAAGFASLFAADPMPEADAATAAASETKETPADPINTAAAATAPLIPALHTFAARRQQVDVRGILLMTLTVLAVLFALRSAKEFIIPLVVSIILAYALDPVVSFLQRRRIPRAVGAVLVMMAIVVALVSCTLALRGQAEDIVNQLPAIATKISKSVGSSNRDDDSMMDKLQRVATVIEKSSQDTSVRRIVVDRPPLRVSDLMLSGSLGLATFVGQTVMVLFLVFFLLLSGDTFRRKFIKLAGHTLSEKKISVHMLDEINRSIQRYMAMLLVTNVGLAIATWIAFRMIGLENAGTWALVAGALHMVPYFGPVIVAICTGVAAFMQFGTLGPAILTGLASLAIATLIGTLVTTWMTGRIAKMNVVAVFISLLLFTWIWGVWGTLLSIPITVITKVAADHIDALEPLAEFLGE